MLNDTLDKARGIWNPKSRPVAAIFGAAFAALACLCSAAALSAETATAEHTPASNSTAKPWPEGTLEATCAPYDGAAFMALSRRDDGTFVRLTGMAPLTDAVGTWPIEMGAQPGKGEATICDEHPASVTNCAYGNSGTFRVEAIKSPASGTTNSSPTWRITYSGQFTKAGKTQDLHGEFIAHPVANTQKLLCG